MVVVAAEAMAVVAVEAVVGIREVAVDMAIMVAAAVTVVAVDGTKVVLFRIALTKFKLWLHNMQRTLVS